MVLIPDDYDDDTPRRRAEDAGRSFAAAISGAIEGFLEAADEFELSQAASEGLHQAGDVAREVGSTREARDVADATRRAADKVSATASDAAETVRDTAHDVRRSAQRLKEEVKVRAEAVGESGRRAVAAPRRIGHQLRKALEAWWTSLVVMIMGAAALFVLGIVTLIVITIALVVGLDQLLGDPAGTWVVAAIYVVAMLVAWASMRTTRAHAKAETRRRIEHAKDEARHVAAPVRSAFGGRGRAGY